MRKKLLTRNPGCNHVVLRVYLRCFGLYSAANSEGLFMNKGGNAVFDHTPGGSNVLYLDGHVQFLKFPGDFPVIDDEDFLEENGRHGPG